MKLFYSSLKVSLPDESSKIVVISIDIIFKLCFPYSINYNPVSSCFDLQHFADFLVYSIPAINPREKHCKTGATLIEGHFWQGF